MSRSIAFVFARGGSEGVRDKNLSMVGGVSLVGRAIRAALEATLVDEVIVSTDSSAIAAEAERHGAAVPWLRPAELATSTASEWLSWQHAVQATRETSGDFALFVSVPPTAPLRRVADIDRAIEHFQAGTADLVVTIAQSGANPYFNLVVCDDSDELRFVTDAGGTFSRRQDAPTCFELTPVAYVTTPEHVLASEGVFDGRVSGLRVAAETAIDIDTELDLEFARFLAER